MAIILDVFLTKVSVKALKITIANNVVRCAWQL